MSKIKIFLNGEERFFEKMTLFDLVQQLELDSSKIAIEKDLKVISREEYKTIFLEEGCRIELVHFIGGG